MKVSSNYYGSLTEVATEILKDNVMYIERTSVEGSISYTKVLELHAEQGDEVFPMTHKQLSLMAL
jgi:hypothetical protein